MSSEEKIFSAVLVPLSCSQGVLGATFEISTELQKIGSELLGSPGIKEFHFCHICHKSKEFENVPVEPRKGMLKFVATFLAHYPPEIITVGWEEAHQQGANFGGFTRTPRAFHQHRQRYSMEYSGIYHSVILENCLISKIEHLEDSIVGRSTQVITGSQ